MYFMLRLCRNWDISISWLRLRPWLVSIMLCLINFLNYLILSSLSLSYFSFSFNSISFFSSSIFFSFSYVSMAFSLLYQFFSVYFLCLSSSPIYYSSSEIISGVTSYRGFFFLAFWWFTNIFCSNYFTLFCLVTYCSWFFLRIL